METASTMTAVPWWPSTETSWHREHSSHLTTWYESDPAQNVPKKQALCTDFISVYPQNGLKFKYNHIGYIGEMLNGIYLIRALELGNRGPNAKQMVFKMASAYMYSDIYNLQNSNFKIKIIKFEQNKNVIWKS